MNQAYSRPLIAAVVAAAGMSRRMGAPKQLLPWGDRTVIAQVVHNLAQAGADPVICVTGHRHVEVSQALIGTPARIVFNPDYATAEMLSSYQVGIHSLTDSSCAGTLIALGDQPQIPASLIGQILGEAQSAPDALVIPSYALRRGHPFYIPRRLWSELMALGADATLRTLVMRHDDAIRYVNVATDVILRDLDTPADFAKMQRDT